MLSTPSGVELALPKFVDAALGGHLATELQLLGLNQFFIILKIIRKTIFFQQLTGLPVNGVKKLQFALRVENVPFLRGFSNMRNVSYIPFAFATEKGSLPDEWADMMRNYLFTPLKFIYWALLGTASGAGFLAGRSGVRRLMNNRRARQVRAVRRSGSLI